MVGTAFSQSLEELRLGYPLIQGHRHREMVGLAAVIAGGDASKPDERRSAWQHALESGAVSSGEVMSGSVSVLRKDLFADLHVRPSRRRSRDQICCRKSRISCPAYCKR